MAQQKGTGPDREAYLISLHDHIPASCYLNRDAELDPKPCARSITGESKYLEIGNRGVISPAPHIKLNNAD